MRPLLILCLGCLLSCEEPQEPPPTTVLLDGDEARAYGLAVARFDAAGGASVDPEPLSPEVQIWLEERGYAYLTFEHDTASAALVDSAFDAPGDSAAFVVRGFSVYER